MNLMTDIVIEYAIGDVVYHRMATEREAGLVTGIVLRPGLACYIVTWSNGVEKTHYGMELTAEYTPDYMSD